MTNKHTPGPWHIGMRPGPIVYGADSAQVADLRGDLVPRDESIANMRLIAAAPDLLTALQALTAACRTFRNIYQDHDNAVDVALEAIAKATKETVQS